MDFRPRSVCLQNEAFPLTGSHLEVGFLPTMQPDLLPENSKWNLGSMAVMSYRLLPAVTVEMPEQSVRGGAWKGGAAHLVRKDTAIKEGQPAW